MEGISVTVFKGIYERSFQSYLKKIIKEVRKEFFKETPEYNYQINKDIANGILQGIDEEISNIFTKKQARKNCWENINSIGFCQRNLRVNAKEIPKISHVAISETLRNEISKTIVKLLLKGITDDILKRIYWMIFLRSFQRGCR